MSRARSLATKTLTLALTVAAATCFGLPSDPPRAAQVAAAAEPGGPRVLAISVDGLNVDAIRRLGPDGTPTLHRFLDEGAGTLNARTELELTITLPNHTGMLTSRRVNPAKGGHGVTWNDERPGATVQKAAGHPVASVFSEVHSTGGSTALYSTKAKFSLFAHSWPRGIDTFLVRENQQRLVAAARGYLRDGAPTFTFLHVSLPDRLGHEYGGMSERYLAAVRRTDEQLGTVVRAVAGEDVVVVLTADHGFATGEIDHSAKRDVENYRIPFVVWGPGVEHGDLYAMNPTLKDPHDGRPSYAGKQPVRNGDLANLALDLLGLGPVPGSGLDDEQSLRVR